jgi:hypothetical protein
MHLVCGCRSTQLPMSLCNKKKQMLDTTVFRMSMMERLVPESGDGVLYAVYGDPAQLERGGHPYWLVAVVKNPYAAPKGLKCAQGKTINKGNWIVNALWYACTSDDPNHKAYVLQPVPLPPGHDPDTPLPTCSCGQVTHHVHVRLSSFVTELGLEWTRYQLGRQKDDGTKRPSTGTFADSSHLSVMRHNFSNVIS